MNLYAEIVLGVFITTLLFMLLIGIAIAFYRDFIK